MARAAPLAPGAGELEGHAPVEGGDHGGEALRCALQVPEGERHRLQGGQVDRPRLRPQAPVAARAAGVDREAGQGGQGRGEAQHLLRLVPGPVDREEHRRGGRASARAGVEPGPGNEGRAGERQMRGRLLEGDARWSSAFSRERRVSQAEQMASRASRGCWSSTTRVREGRARARRRRRTPRGEGSGCSGAHGVSDAEELDLEHQGGVGRDVGRGARAP